MQFGQQEFGNTADGGDVTGELDSFWTVQVTAGDAITMDWEAQYGNVANLRAYPVGTNDFNVNSTYPVTFQDASTNGKDEFDFSAPETGVMPLDFTCCPPGNFGSGGPYDFTAYVQHAVRLSVPTVSALTLAGVVGIGVHNPDGVGITDPSLSVTLQVQGTGQSWATVGSASPTAGTASISYNIPRSLAGQLVNVRAVASGSAYLTETSSTERILVLKPAPPPSIEIVSRTATVDHGHARIALSCRGGSGLCTGTLTLNLGHASVGSAGFSIAAGHRKTVLVNLDRTALRALRRASNHRLNVVAHAQFALNPITLTL